MNEKLSEFLFSNRRFALEFFSSLYDQESKDLGMLNSKDFINLFLFSQEVHGNVDQP
jgi:hypothetical protein